MKAEQAAGAAGGERYVIRVKGHMDAYWVEWFAGMTVMHADDGCTVLTGVLADQAALHGVLARIRDLNLTLVSVERLAGSNESGQGGCR